MSTTPTQQTEMSKPMMVAQLGFLGSEFLTWLYFHIITQGGAIDFGEALPAKMRPPPDAEGKSEVLFAIGKKISLRSEDASGARLSLSGAGLDDNGEVIQAVRRGATISTMALNMSLGHRVYSLTLDNIGTIIALKLPDLFTEPEPEGGEPVDPLAPPVRRRKVKLPYEDIMSLRQDCCDEVEAVVDALLAMYLEKRLDKRWHTHEVTVIRDLVSRGLRSRLVAGTTK